MTGTDRHNMKAVLEAFPEHCKQATLLGRGIKFAGIDNIFVCGVGGSAISGDLLGSLTGNLHINTVRDYALPAHANSRSLVFAVSYSGNTEETISLYKDAVRRKCKIIAISSGGELEKTAAKDKTAHVKVPSGIQPRLATPFLFFPMLNILRNSGLVSISETEIRSAIDYFRSADFRGEAEQTANQLHGKIPMIYASPRFAAAAMKWKTDINENAKVHAFFNVYPEFNHNEINGYVGDNGKYHVIILKDDSENERIEKRMRATAKLIEEKGVGVTCINLKGSSMLTKILAAQYTGLWVSYYLALMYGTDPTPVDIIEDLKREMGIIF